MTGNILFVRHYSWVGKQIRELTKGYYNHVGLMISNDLIIEASFKGVKITKLETYKYLAKKGKVEYCIGKVKGISNAQIDGACKYAFKQVGTKYDFLQFLSLFFFMLFHLNRKVEPIDCRYAFICSELVAKSYDSVGINFNNIDLDVITPADIERSTIVRLIRE